MALKKVVKVANFMVGCPYNFLACPDNQDDWEKIADIASFQHRWLKLPLNAFKHVIDNHMEDYLLADYKEDIQKIYLKRITKLGKVIYNYEEKS